MQLELSVHDNFVYAYHVDCEERRVVLHTVFRDREPQEFTDVVFSDVVAHHLEHALPGNILFDITESDIEVLVRENERLLTDSWRYGWPPVTYKGDLAALVEALKAASVRGYSISSSYGLSGWILAGACERVSRREPARVT